MSDPPPGVVSAPAAAAPLDFLRRYPREKIFRATLVQHGHSSGEQCLFQALWSAATPEPGRDSRILRMGYRGLAAISNLNPKSVKANLKSLEQKLAIETIGQFSSIDSAGRTYRIFSYNQILARRKAAGMVWVRKIKGVEFIPAAEFAASAAFPAPGVESTPGVVSIPVPDSTPAPPETTTPPGVLSTTHPVVDTPTQLSISLNRNADSTTTVSPAIVEALRHYAPDVDDDAVRRLSQACRRNAPDATDPEIVHFIHLKAGIPGIKTPLGFLISAVPKCFEGESLRQFRESEQRKREEQERARRAAEIEMLAFREEQQRVLLDPAASEEDKQFARRMLGYEKA